MRTVSLWGYPKLLDMLSDVNWLFSISDEGTGEEETFRDEDPTVPPALEWLEDLEEYVCLAERDLLSTKILCSPIISLLSY